jgi:hypothetical protein
VIDIPIHALPNSNLELVVYETLTSSVTEGILPLKNNLIRLLTLAGLILLTSGCKLAVINIEGGYVDSATGGRDCRGANVCLHEVTDDTFVETFTAVPDPLWQFVRWNSGGNFVCADSTDPVCVVSTAGTAGIPAIQSVIDSDAVYYLMPVFELIPGTPITQTVTVAGVEWAQPSLFTNLTWDEIAAICAADPCAGSLNGHLMDGWNFATLDDVNAVFNHYYGAGFMGPGATTNLLPLNSIAVMWEAGWNMTATGGPGIDGIFGRVRDVSGAEHYFIGAQEETFIPFVGTVDLFSAAEVTDAPGFPGTGAWFYRIP